MAIREDYEAKDAAPMKDALAFPENEPFPAGCFVGL